MMLKGQRYLCSLPRIIEERENEEVKQNVNVTAEQESKAKELELAAQRGWDLLKDMQGNCIYYASGWWSYSFCYGEGVRQFHQLPPGRNVPHWPPVEDRSVSAFVLGEFEKGASQKNKKAKSERKTLDAPTSEAGKEIREKGLARMEKKGDMRYLVQKLDGGTVCDLTGKPRKTEVQVSIA
jgi:protein OS-9